MDREKVIKGLEIHLKPNSRCVGCPYSNNGLCGDQLYHDALATLKEHEAVKPIMEKAVLDYQSWHYVCSNCEKLIDIQDNFCRHCGRPIEHT